MRGFTLLELAIVLGIIGLLTGSVIVGREIIRGAEVKATATQIDKYRSAVSAFDEKYGNLPGDMPPIQALRLGFGARGSNEGQGDGNGLIEGLSPSYMTQGGGETGLFWVDLTTANGLNVNLIDGAYNMATNSSLPTVPMTGVSGYMPAAKLGRANDIYVYSTNHTNYFGLSAVVNLNNGVLTSTPTLPVWEAFQIDQKIDDGLPLSGLVIAYYVDNNAVFAAAGGGGYGGGYVGGTQGSATPSTNYTCYDNQNNASAALQYSMSTSSGSMENCALSFSF
jgi:prepilin-type N-terminal cleavage/methylation domain-containing protein